VKLRLPIAVVMLFLLILILPFFVSQVESGTSTNTYYPSSYNLSGSTQLVSGSLGNLQSDDGNYMTFRSYPNYDFRFGESLGESSWNTNTEYQDKVVLTFTPSVSADYILIATAEVQGNCISPPDVKARLYIDASTCQELIYRVKDITDWYPFCALKRVNLPASSQTLKIQYAISETTATAKIRNARLYAFSLSGQYAESEAESSWNTNINWQDKVALTFTPSTSGDYLIIATANLGGSSTDYSTLIQFLKDGIVQVGPTRETSASEARYTFGVMRKMNLDATSHTFKIQYKTENTLNTAYISYAHIVAIRLDQFSNNYYTASEGESGPAAANTWYTKVTNTYTAQAADHLIIGSILYKAGSTSRSIGVKLLQGAAVDQSLLVEHKDSTDYEGCFMMAKASLSAGSVTDKIQYMGESTSARVKNATLISLQLPIQHTVEVEFIGSSNTDDWTQLVWVLDSAWTTPSVTVTLQLYNYNLGQYPTSGDGYISYTSSATANTDETKSQTITTNPTHFRDGSGNWKIKVKGIKSTATQFDFEGDLIKFEVTYTLPPVNNPPVAYNQTITTAEDTPKGITLTASDPDSDPLTYFIVTGPSHGSLSGSPPSVTYTPDLNYNGADSFTFKAYDGQAYSNVATVSITVTPVNDPPSAPVVDVTPDFPVTTDDLVCIIITPSIDPDGDPVTYTYEWYKNGILQSAYTTNTVPASATTVGDVWKCVVTPHGSDGPPDEDQVTIQNSPPMLAYIGPKSVNEGTMLSFTATATDPDVPPQTLTFSLGNGAPSGASITSGGAFSWTPTEAQGPGVYNINITVSDGIAIDYEVITVTVNEVNLSPVLNPIGYKTVQEGALLQFTITASDPDIPAQTLTYSASNLPPGATFNPTTHIFSWTPTSGQVGVYPSVHFEVSDGDLTDSEDITITVTAPPLEVSISPTSASILVGQSVAFTSTPSGGYSPYSYQWYLGGVPVSGATSGTWTFTPTTSGIYYVYLQVKDANNNIAQSETARITVIPSAPVGGYSISLAKRTPTSQIVAYTLLIALFGAALSLRKRKRK